MSHPAPQDGVPVEESAYTTVEEAMGRADLWNRQLARDPIYGPACGFVVGVGYVKRGFVLVWRALETLVDEAHVHPNGEAEAH